MKKHLAWILALVTVLAVLAACTTGSGDDSTVEDTTVTDPATNEPTDAPTEEPTEPPTDPAETTPEDTTVAPDDIVVTDPPETEEPADPYLEIDGFALDHERVAKQFSGANAMKAERVEMDGLQVAKIYSTAASQDPFIFFNAGNYCTAKKISKFKADDYRYVILRVKAENCSSAKFELFYCAGSVTGATGECVL